MKILFRADGNDTVGAGHVMRSLAVASAAKKLGASCSFICADASFQDIITAEGIPCIILSTNFKDMESELPLLLSIIRREKCDALLVDSYFATDSYFDEVGKYCPVVYFDDFMNKAWRVDGLINYNMTANVDVYRELYSTSPETIDNIHERPQFFLGEQYAPLREEFQNIKLNRTFNQNARNVLFSAGGSDPEHIALLFVKSLVEYENEIKGSYFHIIMGRFEPDEAAIRELAISHPWIIPHKDVKRMSNIMLKSDVAVSASGSTLYELCACGVPTITYVLEDNQILGAKSMEEKGLMISAGDFRTNSNFMDYLFQKLKDLMKNKKQRKTLSINCNKAIDGKGAIRLADAIIKNYSFCGG